MEVAGLAVGIAGLAGLFSTCADVLERVDAYRDFGITSRQLLLRFESEKIKLQEWADAVGIDGDTVVKHHNPKLDDPRIRKIVERFLVHIKDIVLTASRLSDKNLKHRKLSTVNNDLLTTSGSDGSFSTSKWTKVRWALGREARFTKIVEGLEVVVEKLCSLVPLGIDQTDEDSTAATLLEQDRDQSFVLLDIDKELKGLIEDIRKKASLENLKLIDDVLHPPKIPDQLEVHLKAKLENTCDWVLQSSVYQEWLLKDATSDVTKFLWLYGPPGCGKTILCSSIVESLNEARSPFVFHFFSTLYVQADGKPEDIIRVWISQIARVNQTTLDLVYTQIGASVFSLTLSSADLWRTFAEIVSQLEQCTFIVDGLDEYGLIDMACEDFLMNLKQALETTSSTVLITSRDESEIRAQLVDHDISKGTSKLYWHSITKDDNFADVNLYSQYIVKQKLGKKDASLQRDLALQMAEKCDGMFLWISMSGKELRSGLSRSRLERIVGEVPKGLLPTYERNWRRILAQGSEDKARSLKILQWCTFSIRPLTVAELTEALIVDVSHNSNDLDLEELPEDVDLEYIETEIKNLCGSLIDVKSPESDMLPGSMTVQLVHISVKEYLLSKISDPEDGSSISVGTSEPVQHGELAKVCLRYLCFKNVQASIDSTWSRATPPAFRKYAREHWIAHYRMSNANDVALHNLVIEFFNHENINFQTWAHEYEKVDLFNSTSWNGLRYYFEEKKPTDFSLGSPLYYMVLAELDDCIEFLRVHDGFDINEEGGILGTALQVACLRGSSTTFDNLLRWGANVDVKSELYGSALAIASSFGQTELVRKLLDRTLQVNTTGWMGNTPLFAAAMNNHSEIVKLLLNNAANVNIQDDSGWTPLKIASYYGHVETVQLLLDHGADTETQTDDGWGPLMSAAGQGHFEVVRLLLDIGDANIEAKNINGYTSLYLALESGYAKLTRFLLERGSKTDVVAITGETALHIAVRENQIEIVKLLLENDSDMEAVDTSEGWTPLHHAADAGYLEIMRILLDKGANFSTRDNNGKSCLHHAALNGRTEAVQMLIARGETPWTVYDHFNLNALHFAAIGGNLDVVKLLLKLDDKNVLDNGSKTGSSISRPVDLGERTALHFTAKAGNVEVLRNIEVLDYLIENGFDMMALDEVGKGILDYACISGYEEMVKRVLQLGVQNHTYPKDSTSSWSTIHWACRTGSPEVIRMLIEAKVSFNVVQTSQPATTWLPCDVARYFGNSKLISETGTFLGEHICEEMHEIFEAKSTDKASMKLFGPAKVSDDRYCDGCREDIYGLLFRCTECHPEYMDYCLMCKHDAERLHVGHQWECKEL